MKNKITVTISGQDYNMVAAEDAAYVRRCAEFVDGQIRQVTSGSRLALADAAVLAAMNMADLYFKEQESSETVDNGAMGTVSIRIPLSTMSENAIGNLKNLLQAKETLIKKALGGAPLLPVLWNADSCIDFPWLPNDADPDTINAWTHFISVLCEMARNAHRVSAKEKEIVNEKYEFRCFLLRLGMIGNEYKQIRKILMKNLSGSAAFKNGPEKGGE